MSEVDDKVESFINIAMTQLRLLYAETTMVISNDKVFDIETALRDYRDDLILAFDQPVVFNGNYKLEDNYRSFINLDLYYLGLMSHNPSSDNSTPIAASWRATNRTPKTFMRINRIMNIIYRAVMGIESYLLQNPVGS